MAALEKPGRFAKYRMYYDGKMQPIIEGSTSMGAVNSASNGTMNLVHRPAVAVLVFYKEGTSSSYAEIEKNARTITSKAIADCPALVQTWQQAK